MESRPSLKENIFTLFLLQGSNYIIPLITLPYLVRILGPEKFGLMAFAQGFAQYFVILTDYGFNLSATRNIAIYKQDNQKVSEIFCATMMIKVVIMVLSFIVMLAIIGIVPKFRHDWIAYLLAFLSVPGSVIFPIWFYQGMERMRYISIVTIVAKILSMLAIFLFVQNESDYYLAITLQSCGILAVGLIGIRMIWKVAPVKLLIPTKETIYCTFKDGWHIFISSAAISLYSTSNILILGLITDNRTVGYFSIADKLITAVKGIFAPVSQAIYPRINAIANESKVQALIFIRRCLKVLGTLSFFLSVVTFIGAPLAVSLLFGGKAMQSVPLVRWMAFLPFLGALSNIFGIQTMLTFGLKRQFSKILMLSGAMNIVLLIPFSYTMGAEGAAISVLITEIFVTITMAVVLKKMDMLCLSGIKGVFSYGR